MNFILRRTSYTVDGVFGILLDKFSNIVAYTLEHAYRDDSQPTVYAKIPEGTYACQRGMHKLDHSLTLFETFEIMDVPGHTGILFHVGNKNDDSAGCVLLGSSIEGSVLVQSKLAFEHFMDITQGVDSFILTVKA